MRDFQVSFEDVARKDTNPKGAAPLSIEDLSNLERSSMQWALCELQDARFSLPLKTEEEKVWRWNIEKALQSGIACGLGSMAHDRWQLCAEDLRKHHTPMFVIAIINAASQLDVGWGTQLAFSVATGTLYLSDTIPHDDFVRIGNNTYRSEWEGVMGPIPIITYNKGMLRDGIAEACCRLWGENIKGLFKEEGGPAAVCDMLKSALVAPADVRVMKEALGLVYALFPSEAAEIIMKSGGRNPGPAKAAVTPKL